MITEDEMEAIEEHMIAAVVCARKSCPASCCRRNG